VARLGASGCPGFKPAMVDVLGWENLGKMMGKCHYKCRFLWENQAGICHIWRVSMDGDNSGSPDKLRHKPKKHPTTKVRHPSNWKSIRK